MDPAIIQLIPNVALPVGILLYGMAWFIKKEGQTDKKYSALELQSSERYSVLISQITALQTEHKDELLHLQNEYRVELIKITRESLETTKQMAHAIEELRSLISEKLKNFN